MSPKALLVGVLVLVGMPVVVFVLVSVSDAPSGLHGGLLSLSSATSFLERTSTHDTAENRVCLLRGNDRYTLFTSRLDETLSVRCLVAGVCPRLLRPPMRTRGVRTVNRGFSTTSQSVYATVRTTVGRRCFSVITRVCRRTWTKTTSRRAMPVSGIQATVAVANRVYRHVRTHFPRSNTVPRTRASERAAFGALYCRTAARDQRAPSVTAGRRARSRHGDLSSAGPAGGSSTPPGSTPRTPRRCPRASRRGAC